MSDTASAGTPAAKSFAQFLQMLEDGQTHADLTEALETVNAEMNNHVQSYGGEPKASITLKIDFQLAKGVFEILPEITTKLPKVKRNRTIAWSTPDNKFTPQNPRQMSLFGAPRDVTSGDATEVRKVI